MAKRLLLSLTLILLVSTGAAYAETFGATLTGSQEVPPRDTPGFGFATVTLDPSHTSVHVRVVVTNLTTPITLAHIHGRSTRGVNSSPVIDFGVPPPFTNGVLDRTFTIPKELGDQIAAEPHLYYVNVHTSQFGGGEVRGQLTPIDSVMVFAADLRGANERPNPVTTNALGSAIVTLDQNNVLTYDVNATGLVNPTLAHLHTGVASAAGPPVVDFATSPTHFTGSRVRGTAQLTPALAAQIRANPSAFYVNVHTSANPGGEIRGQLVAANEYDIPVAGRVTGVGGELFVTDVRIFNPSYSTAASALLEYFAAGVGNVTATNSIAVNIPPRGTAAINDIAGASGFNLSGVGGIRVTSAMPLVVTSRIFDDRRARNGGTIGQFVPGFPRSALLRRGVMAQLRQDSQARTNIGFFNPNATPVDIRVEMRDESGAVVGTFTRTLDPLSQQQSSIPAYFPGADLSNRPVLSVSFDASAPILAYGSVIDSVSSDQIFVSAAPDPGSPAP